MRDGVYEADDAILRLERPRVRRDLVDPAKAPATTDEPGPEVDEHTVSVRLEPNGTIARVTIEH